MVHTFVRSNIETRRSCVSLLSCNKFPSKQKTALPTDPNPETRIICFIYRYRSALAQQNLSLPKSLFEVSSHKQSLFKVYRRELIAKLFTIPHCKSSKWKVLVMLLLLYSFFLLNFSIPIPQTFQKYLAEVVFKNFKNLIFQGCAVKFNKYYCMSKSYLQYAFVS